MGEFQTVLRERVAQAAEAYRQARVGGDADGVEQAAGSLADLLKIASGHGVDVHAALRPLSLGEEKGRC